MSNVELNMNSGYSPKLHDPSTSTQRRQVTMEDVMSEIQHWDCDHNIPFHGHTEPVWSITATEDKSYVFSAGEDKRIIIWDAISQQKLGELLEHENTINVLEITRDNKYLISGDWSGKLKMWDWRDHTKIGDFVGHTNGIYCSAQNKAGTILITGAGDYKARVWDINSRRELGSCDNPNSSVFALALTHDEKVLITGGFDKKIRTFDFSNYSCTGTFDQSAGIIQSMSITPNDKFLVFGTRSNNVVVWNWPDKTEYLNNTTHNNWVRNIVTTADSKYYISASADRTIRLFNLLDKEEEFNFDKNDGYVFALYLSKDGTMLYSGASDKIARVRQIGTKNNKVEILEGHKKCIMSVAVTSDSKYIVSGSEDKTLRIWDILNSKEIACMTTHTETIWGVCVSPDMKYIGTASGDKTVGLFSFPERKLIHSYSGHASPIFCVSCSHNSKLLASGAQDKDVCLWDIEGRGKIIMLKGHTDTVFSVKFTYNDELLVSGAADYTLRIWSIVEKRLLEKIDTKSGMIESLAITKDGKFLGIGDRSNHVHLWDWDQKKSIKKFTDHTKWVKCVALSSDDKYLVSASNDMSIRIWNITEKRQELLLNGHTNTIRSVAYTPDGKFIVSGAEDMTIRIWDLNDATILKLSDFCGSLDTFLFLNIAKNQEDPKPKMLSCSISPLRINVVHIYAYLGYHELLRKALEMGAIIKVDALGNSPLHYALERNSQNCIDTILSYLNNLFGTSQETFLSYTWSLRGDFINLLKNRSLYLPEFLDNIFYQSNQKLPNFGVPLGTLPYHHYDVDTKINPDLFLKASREGEEDHSNEIVVEFRLLPFEIDMVSGSSGSLAMLKNIHDCPNRLIYRADLIQILINSRWEKFWWFIVVLTFVNWGNITVMCALLLTNPEDEGLLVLYGIMNLILLVYAVAQALAVGIKNFLTFWNMIDFFRTFLCLTWIILVVKVGEQSSNVITYLMVMANFLRGLSGFRAFGSTRFYVRLIIRAVVDVIPFIFIYFYTTISFGMMFWSSDVNSRQDDFLAIWRSPYELGMGAFNNSDNPDLSYLYFMFTSVINVIIILNLLISVLGNSYDKFQAESFELASIEMTELVLEIETILLCRRKANKRGYIQVCSEVRFEGITDEWEGRLKAINNIVDKSTRATKKSFDDIFAKVTALENKIGK